jgi:hypothetical protein
MSLDGFLTFLGLIAASLAVTSPVARLQLRMAAVRLIAFSVLLFGATLYLEFFDLVGMPCPDLVGGLCPLVDKAGPVTPQQVAFLAVITWLAVLAHAWLRPKVNLRTLPTLHRLVERLVETRSHSDLIDLLEPHLDLIDACASGNLPFQLRRANLVGEYASLGLIVTDGLPPYLFEGVEGVDEPSPPTSLQKLVGAIAGVPRRLKRQYGLLLPERAWARSAATAVLNALLRSPRVVAFISEYRPRFGAQLLLFRSHSVTDFADDFLDWQICHRESSLYTEVRNLDGPRDVAYPLYEDSPVLQALFADSEVARRLAPYQPIGERIIALLKPANGADYPAQLNMPHDRDWDDHGRWNDPLFVGIRFFDVMVRAAVRDGVEWHMWLYYMTHIAESVENNYDESQGDQDREFPTRAGALLSDMVEVVSDWIALANRVPEGSPHRIPDNDRVDAENGNIPKSAAIALGQCLNKLLLSDRISSRVKSAFVRTAISAIEDLPRDPPESGRLRRVTIASVATGGGLSREAEYRERLADIVETVDRFMLAGLDDFTEALGAARGPGTN